MLENFPTIQPINQAAPWSFGSITDGLQKAVELYTSFNTMQSNQALSKAQMDLQIAQTKAQIAAMNAVTKPAIQYNPPAAIQYNPPAAMPAQSSNLAVDYGAQAKTANSNKLLYIGGGIVAMVGLVFLVRRK